MALRQAQEPLPLDAYLATSNAALVNRATGALISTCMSRKGFQYTPGSAQAKTVLSATTAADAPFAQLPYGVVDASRAARYGYSDPPVTDSHRLSMVTPSATPQTAYSRALYGDAAAPSDGPSSGCWEQASSSLQVRIDTTDVNLLVDLIMRA
jgi:hypothetical protein